MRNNGYLEHCLLASKSFWPSIQPLDQCALVIPRHAVKEDLKSFCMLHFSTPERAAAFFLIYNEESKLLYSRLGDIEVNPSLQGGQRVDYGVAPESYRNQATRCRCPDPDEDDDAVNDSINDATLRLTAAIKRTEEEMSELSKKMERMRKKLRKLQEARNIE